MILADAGPLVALLDAGESAHGRCTDALSNLRLPLVTTWPAFTEAMYLLGRRGWAAQELLWRLDSEGHLVIDELDPRLRTRCAELMEQYRDRPMDLADASLVAVAERRGTRRIFTLDADFHIYRARGRRFEVIPAAA